MRALKYFVDRGGRQPVARPPRRRCSPILTIAAGLFVLGFFLIVNTNLRRLTARWGEAAELAVYLRDDATPEQLQAVRVADRARAASPQRIST